MSAARAAFAREGYHASLRGIAREAGVDPALVHHYFKDRAALFVEAVIANEAGVALDIRERAAAIASLPQERIGEGIVRSFVTLWDGVGPERFTAVVRAAMEGDEALAQFRDFIAEGILGELAPCLSPDRPRLRVQLIATQLVGLGMARWAARMDEVALLGHEELVAIVGPTVQRYAVGELPGGE